MDLPFLMLVLILVGIGTITVFSASFATAYYGEYADPYYYAKRHVSSWCLPGDLFFCLQVQLSALAPGCPCPCWGWHLLCWCWC